MAAKWKPPPGPYVRIPALSFPSGYRAWDGKRILAQVRETRDLWRHIVRTPDYRRVVRFCRFLRCYFWFRIVGHCQALSFTE